jgi:hypothetical protein
MKPSLLSIRIPSSAEVLAMGRPHNPSNWENHIRHIRASDGDPGPLITVLRCAERWQAKFIRKHVFDIAEQDAVAGAVAAVVWGFPSGGRPGGLYQSFAALFSNARVFDALITDMRRASEMEPAAALNLLTIGVPGISFATTSKIAYFSNLTWRDQCALIYDRNVIDGIRNHPGVFVATASQVGSGKSHARNRLGYTPFINEAHFQASQTRVSASQIEAALFLSKAKRSWI